MSNKQLIIPIVTPLVKRKNTEFVIEQLEKYEHQDYYVCSRTLNHLKNFIGENYDFVVPCMSTGEGDYLDYELWKSITHLTINLFKNKKGESKCIPCILNLDFVERAFSYLEHRGDIKNVFLPFTKDTLEELTNGVTSSLIKNCSFDISLYVRPYLKQNERLTNEQIINFLKKNKGKIELIKDSRNENSKELTDELILKLKEEKLDIKVFQGWESLYKETNDDCSGGVFPLANLEPQLIYDFVRYKENYADSKIIDSLCKKFNDPQNWIAVIKKEFNSKPTRFNYDSLEFTAAIRKFFEFYSEENLENFHVKEFDVNNPLRSMCRTLLSDMLSFQTTYFRNNKLNNELNKETPEFLFLPLVIAIKDLETNRGFVFEMKRRRRIKTKDIVWKEIDKDLGDAISKISATLFHSIYYIEEKLFLPKSPHDDWFTEFSKDPVTGISPAGDADISVTEEYFKDVKLKKYDYKNNLDFIRTHNTDYRAVDAGNPSRYKIRIIYYKNPNLSAIIPDSVFDFLARIAIFTKRNKIAVDSIERQATSAAISQIMARNMSHNVGSHVSYKATNIAIKNRIIELYRNDFSDQFSSKDKIRKLNKDDFVIDWIDFMSEKLDKYEIHRNEYLANYNLSPQSFRFYQDVILPFAENTLILDNIASAEGAKYTESQANKLKIKVFVKKINSESYSEIKAKYPNLTAIFRDNKTVNEIVYPDNFPYLLKNKKNNEPLSNGINSKEIEGTDVEVLLHSEQAIYSILENFIRNSAKHNKNAIVDKGLEIRLYLEEKAEKYDLIICDNVSKLPSHKLFNIDPPGLYQIIKNDLFDETKLSSRQNLGFADMKINSFLFKNRAIDIKNETVANNFDLVSVNTEELPIAKKIMQPLLLNDEFAFGYQMELLKPRKVLWIGEDITDNDDVKNLSLLKKDGIIQFKDLDAYLKDLDNKNEIAAFDFVVFYESFDYKLYLENQIMLPPRVLAVSADEAEKIEKPNVVYLNDSDFNSAANADELLEKCWQNWLNRLGETKAYIYYENNPEACETIDSTRLGSNQTIRCAKKLEEEITLDNNSISIFYDHHGEILGNTKLKLEKKYGDYVTNFYTKHSKIVFDKGSDDFSSLSYLPADEFKKKLLAYQLIDAATTNIFILDERIALKANNETNNTNDKAIGTVIGKYDGLNFSRYCYGKVFAINSICAGEEKDKPIHSETLNYYLSLQVNENEIKLKIETDDEEVLESLGDINTVNKDILLIHRTYLKEDILGMKVNEFLKLAGKIFGSIIVTSGGGYPHNLQEEVRFIPFSIVEQCVGSRLSKLKLIANLQKLKYI